MLISVFIPPPHNAAREPHACVSWCREQGCGGFSRFGALGGLGVAMPANDVVQGRRHVLGHAAQAETLQRASKSVGQHAVFLGVERVTGHDPRFHDLRIMVSQGVRNRNNMQL
jgi:hypothetical protein